MAESSTTRATLRRAVCRELRMPFFRRIGNSSTVGAASTISLIVDSKLTQPDKFWDNHWFYNVTTDEWSLIKSFQADADSFALENPTAVSPVGNTYEIQSIWNAAEIHEAINESIRNSRRSFPETSTDETLVVQENSLSYSVSSLDKTPWIINKLWIEQRSTILRDLVISATSTTAELPGDISAVNSNWKITIYAGTGRGQIRAISSVNGQEVTVSSWTTIPDATSKFCLFDASDDRFGWVPFIDFHLDSEEFPDTLYINQNQASFYGMRIRIEYISISSELASETDTTNVPQEYIKWKTCSILHGQALSSAKVDSERHFAEFKRYEEMSDAYIVRNGFHTPGTQFRNPDSYVSGSGNTNNPLGWSNP